jgi:dimethylaniline monooxygenase (N-oxide forming)
LRTSIKPVAVIGAGPSGLPACRALADAGLEYECLEANDRVGGIWNLGNEPSGAYRSLQTNTSTRTMAYRDFPFAKHYPLFPHASELQQYFEEYATHFGLRPQIRFGHRVKLATPLPGGEWCLEFESGEARDYSAVIVASGQYVRPRNIESQIPGKFDGEQIHIFDYHDPVSPIDCRGKRVIVVGLGTSAAELAAELSDPNSSIGAAGQVIVSARSGRWVLDKLINGKPIDAGTPHPAEPLPRLLRALPPRLGIYLLQRGMGVVLKRHVEKHGGFEGLGLPRPVIKPWEERPTISLDFIPALKQGRIDVRPEMIGFDGHRVRFADDSETEADVIIFATGYELEFPFLTTEVLGCKAPDLSLYQQILHPAQDNLFFLGCLRLSCSLWPVAEQQGRWIAKLLTGQFTLPARTKRVRLAIPLARSNPVMCNFYVDGLRREAGAL